MDKLIVKGLGGIDGEYEFDIVAMVSTGHPETLTNREGHRVKQMSGVRAGELFEAIEAGDNDVLVALAAIILARAGKRFNEDSLWDAPMGSGLDFQIEQRTDEQEDGEEELPPPSALPLTDPSEPREPSGGGSSPTLSALPESDPSPTGPPDSPKSVISDPETLAS